MEKCDVAREATDDDAIRRMNDGICMPDNEGKNAEIQP